MKLKTLHRSGNELASAAKQREILQDQCRLPGDSFATRIGALGISGLRRQPLQILQINVGKICNQTCTHCHVDAGPDRRESMSLETAQQIVDFLSHSKVDTLDITGGAPEINPHFRMLVQEATRLEKNVIDRCNLTILLANGFTDLPEFLAEHRVNIVASLPCYLEENCDAQRGNGVFAQSIQAIRRLNQLGYGQPDAPLTLDLVYNPIGLGLPPDQPKLEQTYRHELNLRYGIQFNRLFAITNMPISRFLDDLLHQNQYEHYMQKLIDSFNPSTLDGLMCRSLISVDWQGFLYDCDFNQMLDMPVQDEHQRWHISQLNDASLLQRTISIANHCYGCAAGCGSSCGGSLLP